MHLTYAGNLENLNDLKYNPSYEFVQGDICDKELVQQLVKNVDTILNFAAESHVDRSITGPEIFIDTAVFILQLLKGKKVPVYGDGLNIRDWLYVYDHCAAHRCCFA
ncbi:MAG: GDP-mannose 4,6-dehydratase [Endomicrobium sp.]|jgi:dTDP-D-glucose 4,6-dehydratase|nr:GDP-mannose 4,6-dehydratase [Endomicrobium sp.]